MSTVLSPLVIKMPKPVLIDSFSFRTGPSDEQLDPVEWRLEGSNDQNTWKVLHLQETSYHAPRRRCGQASWFETSSRGLGASGKSKLVPWTSGVKIVAGAWHALTMAVDLPNSKMTIWVDGEARLRLEARTRTYHTNQLHLSFKAHSCSQHHHRINTF